MVIRTGESKRKEEVCICLYGQCGADVLMLPKSFTSVIKEEAKNT